MTSTKIDSLNELVRYPDDPQLRSQEVLFSVPNSFEQLVREYKSATFGEAVYDIKQMFSAIE